MFKNLTLFRVNGDMPESAAALEEALSAAPFIAPGATQPRSAGWVAPREEGGALVEAVDGQWIIELQTETRILPTAVVNRKVDELAAAVERETGRKPGKKHRRELRDEAVLALLPQAFTKVKRTRAWIDPGAKLLAINSATSSEYDLLVTALVQCAPRMNLFQLQTAMAPDTLMNDWVATGEASNGFTIDRDVEMKAPDGAKPMVRYARHSLDGDDVRAHIAAGKRVTKLALTFGGKVSFELHANGAIRRLADVGIEAPPPADGDADRFDADVVLMAGELMPMIMALVEALGGEQRLPLEAATSDEPPPPAESEDDPAYPQAVAIVRQENRAGISLVQRHLRIGYNRAARLLERMVRDGLVTPMDDDGQHRLNIVALAKFDAEAVAS